MQVKLHHNSPTSVSLTVVAQSPELQTIKQRVLENLGKEVKLAGFRQGTAPLAIVEKQVDPRVLEKEFIEAAVNQLYSRAVANERLRPVDSPKIEIIKFVPYSTLEFNAQLAIIGEVHLADYQKFKLSKGDFKIEPAEVSEIIENLRLRLAEKSEVSRPAASGDQVTIKFSGQDPKTFAKIPGTDGEEYPLLIGSGNFVPGFEEKMIGLSKNKSTNFTITFPKDYIVKNMAARKVNFQVKVLKVESVKKPEIDDHFAAKVGPFKSIHELKIDIKKQLTIERQNQLDRNYENEIIKWISLNSTVPIPENLIEEHTEHLLKDFKQRLIADGQTIEEFYQANGTNEADYRQKVLKNEATERLKAGILLAEIGKREAIKIANEAVEQRVSALKNQYKDQLMQAELDKPQSRDDIAARILTEQTIQRLVKIVQNNSR